MANTDVVIVSAARTPIGAFNGALSQPAGARARQDRDRRGAEARQGRAGRGDRGGPRPGPDRPAPARTRRARRRSRPASRSRRPPMSSTSSAARACARSRSAIQAIRNGDSEIVVAGGQESMSLAPHCMHLRNGTKMGDTQMIDTMIKRRAVGRLQRLSHGQHRRERGARNGRSPARSRTSSPPPRRTRPRPRRRPASSRTRSSR